MGKVIFDENGLAYYQKNGGAAKVPVEGWLSNEKTEKCKVLFILKEPRSRDETNPYAYQTDAWWNNLEKARDYRSKLSLIVNKLYPENSNADNKNLDGCAYINIRPQFGYKNVNVTLSDDCLSYKDAFEEAKENKTRERLSDTEIAMGKISFENVRKSIEHFKPQKIVCCGCFNNVADILDLKRWEVTKKPQKYQNTDVYYVYHPAARIGFDKSLSFLDY